MISEKLRKTENLLNGIVQATKCLLIISDYDLAINQAIAMLGKATEVDVVRIFQIDNSQTDLPLISQWYAWAKEEVKGEDTCPLKDFSLIEEGFERWYDLFKNGNSVKGAVALFPAKERDNQVLAGIKSLLACPIMIKGVLWGYILYENKHSEQIWCEQEEAVLMTVAAGLGAVIGRRRAEEALGLAYEDLELRVAERTQKLAAANETLHNEIVERIRMEERLRFLGQHDPLTGLKNRAFFQEEMRSLDSLGSPVGIILCDVDGLKYVNDFLGHDAGDRLLIAAAKALKMCFREDDCIARIGGDEFAILLKNTSQDQLARACVRIKEAIARNNKLEEGIPLSLSVGCAGRNGNSRSLADLFKEADNNMYKEKVQSTHKARSSIAKAMMKVLRKRECFDEGYEFRLEKIVANLAIAAGVSEVKLNDLALLAQFHNYSSITVPPEVMLKEGELTESERIQIKRHCENGQRIAQLIPELSQQAEWILSHHEWWNGRGVPQGAAGEQIPLEARILAICDMYDSLTNPNRRTPILDHEEAVNIINKQAGSRLDPFLVERFIEITG